MNEYPNHPAAELFPMMPESELAELAADIKANGLIERIIIHDGMILDGRNRYAACQLAGVEPLFQNPQPPVSSPVAYVASKNLHRRQLSISQRAAIGAEMIPLLQSEYKARQVAGLKNQQPSSCGAVAPNDKRSREVAAEHVGVSDGSIQRAWAVRERSPEVFDKLKSGELTVRGAERQARETSGEVTQPPTTLRRRQVAESQKRRMESVLSTINGCCRGLEDVNVAAVVSVSDVDEIKTWVDMAYELSAKLKTFSGKLKGGK